MTKIRDQRRKKIQQKKTWKREVGLESERGSDADENGP